MFKVKRAFLLLILPGMFAVNACRGTVKGTNAPLQKVRLQLNWTHGTAFAGYYQAIEQEYYQAQNLDVELVEGGLADNGYIDPTQALQNGTSDFAILTFAEYQSLAENTAADEAQHPVVVMGLFQISPVVLFSLQESGIQTLPDVAGRRVAIISEPWGKVVTQALKNVGLSRQDIQEVHLDSPDMTAFFKQRVDVWTGYVIEEVVEAQVKGYRVNLIFPADYGANTYEGLLVTTQGYAESHPEVIQAMVQASLQGWRQALSEPRDTASLLERWNPHHTRIYYELGLDYLRPLVDTGSVPLGWIDVSRWQQAMGTMGANLKIDIDMRYVESAYTQE